MARCIQEETREEVQEMPMPKVLLLPFLLMQRKEIIPRLNQKERLDLRLEENDDVTFAIKQVTMYEIMSIMMNEIMDIKGNMRSWTYRIA